LQRNWKFEDYEVDFHMPANSTMFKVNNELLVARLDAFLVRKSKGMWALYWSLLIQTPGFEWYMAKLVVKNGHQNLTLVMIRLDYVCV
jgi:hypothetical protein